MKLSRRECLGLAGALLGLSAWGITDKGAGGGFSIAALNDLHVVDAGNVPLLKMAVETINKLPDVRLVVVLGDITENAAREQFDLAKQALDGLAKPYLAIPGNHDVISKGRLAYMDYSRLFKDRNWARQEGGWYFLGMDSCQGNAVEVTIPLVRLAWIQEQLQTIPADRPIGLFTHHPFNPHACKYRVKNADKVLDLFSGHSLKLVASGHWHGNQEETRDGVLFTTTACCSSSRENFDLTPAKGFRLFQFGKQDLKTEFVEVDVLALPEQNVQR